MKLLVLLHFIIFTHIFTLLCTLLIICLCLCIHIYICIYNQYSLIIIDMEYYIIPSKKIVIFSKSPENVRQIVVVLNIHIRKCCSIILLSDVCTLNKYEKILILNNNSSDLIENACINCLLYLYYIVWKIAHLNRNGIES